MHELGIMTGVMDAVEKSAREAGATQVLEVTLSVGEMTEAIEDALQFAFEVLSEGSDLSKGAKLTINMIPPKSKCLECGAIYTHDRFHMLCPECGSFATQLLEGRELQIDSIEVDLPDKGTENTEESASLGASSDRA
ncbi:hydrogenase maturation nickel metallochaperone HypA [Adlercreutzia agrestimuris]|uniref:hydrogenase maturation nickel metallochaperone HypA n=1 Tax=Adlercreutzia agrestimuris TaxID=2941324 RepID=UPI00203FAE09|nr:hydrogenase maturation nickel metallochaperone HypA [Adlercreutzia agrestimuris]